MAEEEGEGTSENDGGTGEGEGDAPAVSTTSGDASSDIHEAGAHDRPAEVLQDRGVNRPEDRHEPGENVDDDSWMRPELDIKRMKVDYNVEVRSEGEWWDCEIKEVNTETNEIKVHYIGGTEEEDEWVSVTADKVQLPPLIEMVWAKVRDGAPWPSVVLEGSLRDSFCKKLKVFHLREMAAYSVVRKATAAFTAASIPAHISDEKMEHAINVAKRAMQFGKLPESVMSKIEATFQAAGPRRASASASKLPSDAAGATAGSPPSGGRGRPASKKAAAPLPPREARRKHAMRKLGLIPPLGHGEAL